MKKTVLFMLSLVFVLALKVQAQSRYVGELLNVRGHVSLQRSSDTRDAYTTQPVRINDIVQVAANSRAELVYQATGARYRLLPASSTKVGAARPARVSGPAPQEAGIVRFGGTSGGIGATSSLGLLQRNVIFHREGKLSPFGSVEPGEIALVWGTPLRSAVTVRIIETTDGVAKRTVMHSDLPTDPGTFKIDGRRLLPGRWYLWSVQEKGKDPDSPVRSAWIRLRADGDAATLAQLKQGTEAAEKQARAGDTAELVLIGEAYERLGRFDLARDIYTTALQASPQDLALKQMLARIGQLLTD